MSETAPNPAAPPEPQPNPAPAPNPAPQPDPAQQNQPPAEPQRPDWLPAKFKDPQQLAAAYAELEKKLGSQPPADPPKDPPKAPAPPPAPTPNEELAVRQSGLDPVALEAEFMDNGKVSEETYAKAIKAGLTKEFVDAFVQGRAAVSEAQAKELYNEVGGEDAYNKMAAWARANLSPREIAAFNQAIQNSSLELAKIALRGVQARYLAAAGREPSLIGGDAAGGSVGYRSSAEAVSAMRDPRYAKDPAYRAEVEAKLRAGSPFQARVVG